MIETIKKLIFGSNVLALYRSIKDDPYAWIADTSILSEDTIYYLTHKNSGLHFWVANRPYGMAIKVAYDGKTLAGGVTGLSSMDLSPPHWLMDRAFAYWLTVNKPPPIIKVSVESILHGAKLDPRGFKARNELKAARWWRKQ